MIRVTEIPEIPGRFRAGGAEGAGVDRGECAGVDEDAGGRGDGEAERRAADWV